MNSALPSPAHHYPPAHTTNIDIVFQALKWDLSPMTTNAWLGVYLQVANMENITDQELGFVFPQFSTHAFIQISRVSTSALQLILCFFSLCHFFFIKLDSRQIILFGHRAIGL